ncbi:GTP cyclohydrolase II [Alphaproteobacteria bacterium]|nr:GTP cyclohydrolase II [Alphaproteobacteria bacterium]MDA9816473.1 GTP cyclohydrolase II [Alphaproteobacteria bacterium]MDC3312144.1 GTP cyclohydrolase II [Alphaproteobacteria bacterium]
MAIIPRNIAGKIDTALSALRRGSFIMIRDQSQRAGFIRAAEFADYDLPEIPQLRKMTPSLCFTRQHVLSLMPNSTSSRTVFSLPANALTGAQIVGLSVGEAQLLPKNATFLPEHENSLVDLAIRVVKFAKLLPSALLYRLPISDVYQQDRIASANQIPILELSEIASLSSIMPSLSISIKADLPLKVAPNSKIIMFRNSNGKEEHFAIVVGDGLTVKQPLVRLHSQCVTGDVFGSLKCDCGEQLETALSIMNNVGAGIVLYLAQEGRDIGLLNKIRAYALQDAGLDTVEANHRLGFNTDERGFSTAVEMLNLLNLTEIKLLTNNPDKVNQLTDLGITIKQRIPLLLPTNPHNEKYIKVKKDKTGHLID